MESTVTKNEKIQPNYTGPWFGVRHTQSIFLFFGAVLAYWSRINVSVAIVAMTNPDTNPGQLRYFDWTEKEKSYILSSFFWGYVIFQIPAGHLGHKFGTKMFLLLTVLCPSILTILTPMGVWYGDWTAFCIIRVLQGFFNGAIFPLFHIHIAKWTPIEERNRLGGFIYSGVQFGTIVAFASSGLIATSSFGWPGIFYIPGTFGLIWSFLWIFYGSNCPTESRKISEGERKYIVFSSQATVEKLPVPWLKICTSLPFWALACTRMTHGWSQSTLLAEMPTYMNSILKLGVKSNGLYSSLPYIAMFIISYVFLMIADLMTKNQWASLTVIRKSFNTISEWGPAVTLTALAFVTEDQVPLAITLLTVSLGFSAAVILGSTLNHIDLSPNHSGILMGIANTLTNVISIIVPLVIGLIVIDETNHSQWQIVFFIAAGVSFFGNVIYVSFGQMVKQPWDNLKKNDDRRPSVFVDGASNVVN